VLDFLANLQTQKIALKACALRTAFEVNIPRSDQLAIMQRFFDSQTAAAMPRIVHKIVMYEGSIQFLEILRTHNADLNVPDETVFQYTPLHRYVIQHKTEEVLYLLRNCRGRVRVNRTDSNRRTPLWHALILAEHFDNTKIIWALLSAGGTFGESGQPSLRGPRHRRNQIKALLKQAKRRDGRSH
jgi:hypothetical protein